MKKIIISLLFATMLASNCFSMGEAPLDERKAPLDETRPHNENCYGPHQMKVLQVLDDGILANLCPKEYPSYYHDCFDAAVAEGELVYIAVNPKYNDYVDGQKVTLPKTQCFSKDGTYRYTTKSGDIKTVRKIKIVSSGAPSSTK